ncbi:MAG: sugar phosphate isomerase/epimerase [Planctomycetaceae bacterium]|nr:sugar phosphate isomerase/epimerase [Planctomycetaceae bacterium]
MSKKCPGALSDGSGMRLAVTAAENAGPKAPILLRGDLGAATKTARAIGYQGIEIHVPDIWEFAVSAFKADCDAAGVAVSALVSGQLYVRKGLSICNDDPANVQKAIEGLKLFVDAAATLSTGVVVGWVRGQVGDEREKKLAKQAESLKEVGQYALAKNVPLYIEAINRYELDSLNTAREILDFIDKYSIPSTYIHLDTFHMNIDEHRPSKAIREVGALLGYVHVAENTRWYPGHDRLDFDEVFAALEGIGYDGFVSVECLPYPTGEEAARRAHEWLTYRYFYPKG